MVDNLAQLTQAIQAGRTGAPEAEQGLCLSRGVSVAVTGEYCRISASKTSSTGTGVLSGFSSWERESAQGINISMVGCQTEDEGVFIHGQGQGRALNPCWRLWSYCVILSEKCQERFVVGVEGEVMAIEIGVEPLHAEDTGKPLFLYLYASNIFSAEVSVQEANASYRLIGTIRLFVSRN